MQTYKIVQVKFVKVYSEWIGYTSYDYFYYVIRHFPGGWTVTIDYDDGASYIKLLEKSTLEKAFEACNKHFEEFMRRGLEVV